MFYLWVQPQQKTQLHAWSLHLVIPIWPSCINASASLYTVWGMATWVPVRMAPLSMESSSLKVQNSCTNELSFDLSSGHPSIIITRKGCIFKPHMLHFWSYLGGFGSHSILHWWRPIEMLSHSCQGHLSMGCYGLSDQQRLCHCLPIINFKAKSL